MEGEEEEEGEKEEGEEEEGEEEEEEQEEEEKKEEELGRRTRHRGLRSGDRPREGKSPTGPERLTFCSGSPGAWSRSRVGWWTVSRDRGEQGSWCFDPTGPLSLGL